MSYKTHLINLLRSPTTQRIRYSFYAGLSLTRGFTTMTIDKHAFAQVATALESGKITVEIASEFEGNVYALYDFEDNIIWSSGARSRENDGAMLHECVHAWFDLNRKTVAVGINEAAAYITSSLYFRMTGIPRRRVIERLSIQSGVIAELLLRAYQRGERLPTVDFVEWATLVKMIAAHDGYREAAETEKVYHSDG